MTPMDNEIITGTPNDQMGSNKGLVYPLRPTSKHHKLSVPRHQNFILKSFPNTEISEIKDAHSNYMPSTIMSGLVSQLIPELQGQYKKIDDNLQLGEGEGPDEDDDLTPIATMGEISNPSDKNKAVVARNVQGADRDTQKSPVDDSITDHQNSEYMEVSEFCINAKKSKKTEENEGQY